MRSLMFYIFTFIGLALCVEVAYLYADVYSFSQSAVRSKGRVVGFEKKGTRYHAVVDFNLKGQRVRFVDDRGHKKPNIKVNEVVRIIYKVKLPSMGRIDEGVRKHFMPMGLLIGGLLFLILGTLFISTGTKYIVQAHQAAAAAPPRNKTTMGEVFRITRTPSGYSEQVYIEAKFTTEDGEPMTATRVVYGADETQHIKVGSQVQIEYEVEHPNVNNILVG